MIVVAILGLLASIAMPNLIKARNKAQASTCVNNLRLLSGAVDQWALESRKGNGTQVAFEDIELYIKGSFKAVCPAGGTYNFGIVGDEYPIACSISEHNAPFHHN